MAKAATAVKESKTKIEAPEKDEPTKTKKPRVAVSKFSKDSVITLLVDFNPKRKGSKSAERFEAYEDGMTVEEALKAGLESGDLNWDVAHKHIKIGEEFDEDVEKRSKPLTKAEQRKAEKEKEEEEPEEEPEDEEPAAKPARRKK